MENINKNQDTIGVIVGRFQTPKLTPGHLSTIGHVYRNHNVTIIIVGTHVSQPTNRNPLPALVRSVMLKRAFPEAIVLQLADQKSDRLWSAKLDALIKETCKYFTNPENAILYGSRDSFIKSYIGQFLCHELPQFEAHNATELREFARKNIDSSYEFRQGIIYGIGQRHASPYLAVDAAVIRDKTDILLGKKLGEEYYRFIGGFVDSSDKSIQAAAEREVREECGGMIVGNFILIGEARIDDWRYRHDEENIFTNLFICDYISGHAKPTDDISELEWIPLGKLSDTEVVPEHEKLKQILINHLQKK